MKESTIFAFFATLCLTVTILWAVPGQQVPAGKVTTKPPTPQQVRWSGVTDSTATLNWTLGTTRSVTGVVVRVFQFLDDGSVITNQYLDSTPQLVDSMTISNLPSSTVIGGTVQAWDNK